MSDARPGVAAFDFDGTLVGGDSLPRFLRGLLGAEPFARALVRAAPRMVGAYPRHGRDGSKAALLKRAVAGRPAEPAFVEGRRFAEMLAATVRADMMEILDWHKEQGHRRILVSASLAVYLDPFGELIGLDDVIATRLEVGPDGRFTGRIDGLNVRAAEKARRLRAVLGSADTNLWAYGNSRGDREMLAMADHPVLVRRRPQPVPWRIDTVAGSPTAHVRDTRSPTTHPHGDPAPEWAE